MKNVTFLLPPYNEKKSIENLFNCNDENFQDSKIIIIINNSIEKKMHIAKKYGSHVLHFIKRRKCDSIKK